MNLELSDDHKTVLKTAREFAEKEVKPHAHEIDESGEFPRKSFRSAAEIGFTGVYVPEQYGGAGMDHLAYSIIIEEISRVCASTGVILSVCNTLFCDPILRFGNEEQKRNTSRRMRGERIGCYCLTEPQAGSDAANQKTMAVKKGDKYILNGTKAWVTNGAVAEDAIVYAVTDPSKGAKGISAFIVEAGFRGWKVMREEKKMGIAATATAEISLQDCEVPAANLIGAEGIGFRIALRTLDDGRVGIAAQATGIAQGALDGRSSIPRSARPSASPLPAFRPFSSCWPTWRRRLRLRGCCCGAPPGCRTRPAFPPSSRVTASRLPSPSSTPARWRRASATRRSRFTAATATAASTRSSACTATSASPSSTKAQRNSTPRHRTPPPRQLAAQQRLTGR
jgi:butyryl-CoA dehydrogenase